MKGKTKYIYPFCRFYSKTLNDIFPNSKLKYCFIDRQKKSLHDLDNRDESEFAKLMYVYIRAGMLEAAQEVCEQSGHPWRAGNFGLFFGLFWPFFWPFLFILTQGCLKQFGYIGYLEVECKE